MRFLKIFDSANTVAVLWVISLLLPFAMYIQDAEVWWLPWLAAAVLVLSGISINRYRAYRIATDSWRFSDTIVYVIVPVLLFVFSAALVLGTVQRNNVVT